MAGGTTPELLVGKKGKSGTTGGSFSATIPLNNIEGTLTLTYYQNNKKLTVSSTTSGVSGGQTITPSSAGQQTTTFTGITTSMTSITIVFQVTTTDNVRLDNIVLTGTQAGGTPTPSMSVSTNSIDFGSNPINPGEPYTETFNVSFANLTESLTVTGFSGVTVSPNTINANATSPQTVTVYYNPTAAGSISGNISVNSSEVTEQLVAVSGSAYDPENVDTYELYNGTIVEGDYVICYEGQAMKNTVSSNRLGYMAVTPINNEIVNPNASIVWHIAQSGNYWTIYNENVNKYAAGTTSKNQAALLDEATSDLAKWIIPAPNNGSYNVENFGRASESDPNNKFLRYNSGYGYACYASSTGGALSLYKKLDSGIATTTTINVPQNFNTDIYQGTNAGTLTATVKDNENNAISGATVTWSSSNTGVATIDANGAVTLVAVGTTTISANYAGVEDEYRPSEGTYELTVIDSYAPGTVNNPYTVAQAIQNTPATNVYIRGKVSSFYNNNIMGDGTSYRYNISDDGTTTTEIRVYKGKDLNQNDFNNVNDVLVGDEVVLYGSLNVYQGVHQVISSYIVSQVRTCSRTISGYGTNTNTKSGYYLIASPVNFDIPTDAEMISGSFDLYRFNENADLEWENYKEHGFGLEPGKGYLYAHNTTIDLTVSGTPYTGDGVIPISYTSGAEFAGWNLVGNPFGVAATIDMEDFYVMDATTGELITSDVTTISAMEGIFVEASGTGQSVTFNPQVNQGGSGNKTNAVVLNLTRNRGDVIDRAIVRFGEGSQLHKFQLRENSTKVYFTEGNQDFAVVRSQKAQGEMPVNFKAQENGTYTLSVNTEEMELNYLHLIDNMTGMDVDLLQTPSYTFDATTNDYASRFRLVFSANNVDGPSTGSEAFAFYSNGNWVVGNEGEATLQVIDVNGRIVSNETINGTVATSINATPGVYMLRLVNGNEVKTQKIVVR